MVSAVRAVAQYIKTDEYRVYILSTLERTISGQKEPARSLRRRALFPRRHLNSPQPSPPTRRRTKKKP